MSSTETKRAAVELRRTISAPPGEVYRAFLDPDRLLRWFCPVEMEVSSVDVDERVGGRHYTEFHSPEYGRHAFEAEIVELVPGERVALKWVFVDLDTPRRSEESLLTVTLAPGEAGTTELTLVHSQLTPDGSPAGVEDGWNTALGKLAGLYEGS